MATTIDWPNKVISIPRADLTLIQSSPTEIRQLDLNTFRLDLKDLEDNEEGMTFILTHIHNPPVTVGGVILSRVIELINGYTVTFEDGQYAVNLVGANSNVSDVVNVNQVSVRSANSAGLQDLSTLLASAYQGRVVVDVINGQSGTDTPIGTFKSPVNNMTDALSIAAIQGIKEFLFLKSMTLNEDFSSGFAFIGSSPSILITVNPAANVDSCTFEFMALTGTLGLTNVIRDTALLTITNVSGFLEKCAFIGDITITGNTTVLECYSGLTGDLHTDFTITSGNLIVEDFHGSIGVNSVTSGIHTLGVSFGSSVLIESGCTGGTIYLTGEPYSFTDTSAAGCTVIDNTSKTSLLGTTSFP